MTVDPIEDIRARFARVAGEWDANPARVALAQAVVAAIRQAVPLHPGMQTLDFGAGTGLLTLGLAPYVGPLTAADASPAMLQVLSQKLKALPLPPITTWCGDIAREPLPAAAFDLIVSSMVLHHLPDVPHALQRLRPSLRPGGWIALADLDTEDGSFHTDPTGVCHHGFDRAVVCRWLQQAGFEGPTAREAHRMVRPAADGSTHTYPIFLVTARAGG